MLSTKDLAYTYNDSDWISFPDMDCQPDQRYLIIGQSGTGKTTFLHLLAGLLKPKKGVVSISGQNLSSMSGPTLDRFRGDNIGIIFQQTHFMDALDVEENLMIAQKLAGHSIDKPAITKILKKLNIGHKQYSRTKNLSQGEKQRVAIARALINKPVVILADEPTSALDDKNCLEVVDLLERTADDANATLLIVTHDNRLIDHFPNQIKLS